MRIACACMHEHPGVDWVCCSLLVAAARLSGTHSRSTRSPEPRCSAGAVPVQCRRSVGAIFLSGAIRYDFSIQYSACTTSSGHKQCMSRAKRGPHHSRVPASRLP